MHLNPYGEGAVRLALSLATDPPPADDALVARCHAFDLVIDRPVTVHDRPATAEFLAEWLGVIDATSPAERAERLNGLLRFASAYPRLTDHADSGWHLHYRDLDQPLAAQLRTLISVGTALHLAGRGIHRLGRCAADGCTTPYADFSRTGRQAYCSSACGNRSAVRRHRARQNA
ncbi:CGNR zinc finger domain-containing protein [Actinoplanes solisilvae]|uniref:CGNR zinc finger domain-containing protein n=1 Tax=Actinoplanes solisilvae TaxID=2486853 RepID=UPI000FDA6D84|nr:CGNR zinc finger domain-containing protein [Actinoplanes solisilvae]